MKKELLTATSVLLSLVLPAHAQTDPAPADKTARPNSPAKTTTTKTGRVGTQHSEQLGQKFINKSKEDTKPMIIRPAKRIGN